MVVPESGETGVRHVVVVLGNIHKLRIQISS